jgi:class 3 adenylate cyclase
MSGGYAPTVPRLQVKTFADPDERRTFPLGHAELVHLEEVAVGRAQWEPGWRFTTHLAPVHGTATCQVHHLGFSVSGHLRVETESGETIDIPPESVYEIPPGHDAWVVGDEPWVTVEWTSARIVGIAPDAPAGRTLATVLFTDIVDSTATLQRLGDAVWRDLLLKHNARMRDALNTYRGREVATTGDGFLAVFDGATNAVRCGVAMAGAAREVGLPIRIGLHTGEVEFVGGNVRGVAVHTAARVMSLAGADEVYVSATTSDLLEGSGVRLEDAGVHELKGLTGHRQVFRVAE